MRERVTAIIGRPAEGLWLGTFHALPPGSCGGTRNWSG